MSDHEDIQKVTVLSKKTWTPSLFSFTVTRPKTFKFTAGQFVRLGVNPSQLKYYKSLNIDSVEGATSSPSAPDEDIFRAYSIVSSPYDDEIEFFSIVIPNGAFTSQLQYLQPGDELLLKMTPFGFLTLARYQQPTPKDLWLLATGTGVAPFLSMLQAMQTWQDYEHVILAYSVREHSELAYIDKIKDLESTYAQLVDKPAKFTFVPIVTREKVSGCLNQRLPKLLISRELERVADASLDPNTSHVMLCGNPQMVEDTKETLKSMGLVMNRRGVGNIAVENYW